jgi:hypothetical protein
MKRSLGHIPKLGRGNGEYWPYILRAAREVAFAGPGCALLLLWISHALPVSNWDGESYFEIVFQVSFKAIGVATHSLLASYIVSLTLACGVPIGRDDSRNKP